MKSYQIHLIRHGTTALNAQGCYVGVTDAPLSEEGKQDLMRLAKTCPYPRAAVYYTSPLKRCVETCSILYPEATPIAVEQLAECNFGIWEGKSAKDLQHDELFRDWLSTSHQTAPPGGESGEEFTNRVLGAFSSIVEGLMRTGTTSAVIVTHGGVIMTLLTAFGLPRANFYDWMVGNGCGYTVRITPSLWMREPVFEVVERIPRRLEDAQAQRQDQYLNLIREAADHAYGNQETGKKE